MPTLGSTQKMVGWTLPKVGTFVFSQLMSSLTIILRKKTKVPTLGSIKKMVGLDAPKRHLKSSRRLKKGSQEAPEEFQEAQKRLPRCT